MLNDPYAAMRALLRAEVVRNTPKPDKKSNTRKPQQPPKDRERG